MDDPLPTYWVGCGKVTDPESPAFGQSEWQFSDGPVGQRSASEDFLSLEEGLAALSPCIVHWDGDPVQEFLLQLGRMTPERHNKPLNWAIRKAKELTNG